MEAPDLALAPLDARALAKRAAIPAAVLAAGAALVLLGAGPAQAFANAIDRALEADPRWVIAGAAFEVLSFAGYIALLWLVGNRASSRLGLRESTQITLGGAAATRLLPTAGVGGAALTLFAIKRIGGMNTKGATRTLLTFLVLLYAVFLGAIVASGTVLAVRGDGPLALTALPAALALTGMLTALYLGLTERGTLGKAVRQALIHLRERDGRLAGALVWWAFDAAVLVAMFAAFGGGPALAVIVLAYFVGQLGNTIPLPGAVSGGMIGVLLAFGVDAELALVSVLSYRAVAIWLPTPVGLLALGGLRTRLRPA
jgi:uncharacterized membrane protein YbhN (UPF0104 family)